MRTTIPSFVLREESEDIGRNPSANPTMGDVIAARFSRRDILKGALGVDRDRGHRVARWRWPPAGSAEAQQRSASFSFDRVEAGVDETHHVAPGYDADILIRWGDPVLPGAPPFDPTRRPRPRRSSSSATTTTSSAISRCEAQSVASTACSWSTTNTPTRS